MKASMTYSGNVLSNAGPFKAPPFGSGDFAIGGLSSAQRLFLECSLLSAETSDDGVKCRLHFKGGAIGPWFDADSKSLTFAKVTKGAFRG